MEKKRVLIIDDDADIRFMLNYFLTKKGFQVEGACDGQAALEQLATSQQVPDFILLDWIMPVMNGYMFLKFIAETNKEAFAKTSFIIFSGIDINQDLPIVGRSANLLMKPFNIDHLFQLLKTDLEVTAT